MHLGCQVFIIRHPDTPWKHLLHVKTRIRQKTSLCDTLMSLAHTQEPMQVICPSLRENLDMTYGRSYHGPCYLQLPKRVSVMWAVRAAQVVNGKVRMHASQTRS